MRAFRKFVPILARPLARVVLIAVALCAGIPVLAAQDSRLAADRDTAAVSPQRVVADSDPLRGPLLDLRRPPRAMSLFPGGRTVAMSTCSPGSLVRPATAVGRKSGIAAMAAAWVVHDVDVADSIYHSGFEIFGSSCAVNANCPATGDECIGNTCTAGICSGIPATTGTACADGICNGSGSCVQCLANADCPSSSECATPTCTAGVCGQQNLPTEYPCPGGVGVCDGAGTCVSCVLDNDCPDSGQECVTKACTANVCTNPFAPMGTPCSVGQCDGTGGCVQCLANADCPVTGECRLPMCSGGVCLAVMAAPGTPCGGGGHCDISGNCGP